MNWTAKEERSRKNGHRGFEKLWVQYAEDVFKLFSVCMGREESNGRKKMSSLSVLKPRTLSHAGDQVPPAARGDWEAGGPRAKQRAERGPGGAVQRGEPVHRPGPVQEAVDADHHGRA